MSNDKPIKRVSIRVYAHEPDDKRVLNRQDLLKLIVELGMLAPKGASNYNYVEVNDFMNLLDAMNLSDKWHNEEKARVFDDLGKSDDTIRELRKELAEVRKELEETRKDLEDS